MKLTLYDSIENYIVPAFDKYYEFKIYDIEQL